MSVNGDMENGQTADRQTQTATDTLLEFKGRL